VSPSLEGLTGSALLLAQSARCRAPQANGARLAISEACLADVLTALEAGGYAGLAQVELSRDAHRGAWAAPAALKSSVAASPGRARG
jgi:hypothetical protein